MTLIASLIAIPVGVGGGVYLSEYAQDGWFSKFVRFGNDVLAGVPSIICGVFIYSLIVTTRIFFDQSFSAMAGGIALSVLMLPTVIKTTYEGLLLVPQEMRMGPTALGLPGSSPSPRSPCPRRSHRSPRAWCWGSPGPPAKRPH